LRPIPIPDDEVIEDPCFKRVIAAPDGDLLSDDIRPVEAVLGPTVLGERVVLKASVLIQLESGDLEELTLTGRFWIHFCGGIVPFSVELHR